MQKIGPFLWFNDNAEEAVNFYVSIFKNSKITKVKAKRVMQAMMKMVKIDIAKLQQAYEGK